MTFSSLSVLRARVPANSSWAVADGRNIRSAQIACPTNSGMDPQQPVEPAHQHCVTCQEQARLHLQAASVRLYTVARPVLRVLNDPPAEEMYVELMKRRITPGSPPPRRRTRRGPRRRSRWWSRPG